jgi:hypothetical protein
VQTLGPLQIQDVRANPRTELIDPLLTFAISSWVVSALAEVRWRATRIAMASLSAIME